MHYSIVHVRICIDKEAVGPNQVSEKNKLINHAHGTRRYVGDGCGGGCDDGVQYKKNVKTHRDLFDLAIRIKRDLFMSLDCMLLLYANLLNGKCQAMKKRECMIGRWKVCGYSIMKNYNQESHIPYNPVDITLPAALILKHRSGASEPHCQSVRHGGYLA